MTPSEQAPNINFNLFQMLPVSAPSDVHCVYSKNSLFLAVADSYFQVAGRRYYNADSILYRFNGLFFVEYQKIPALGAWKWNSVELNTGDGILTLLSSEDLRAFGHDEFSWYPISIEPKNGLLGVADVGNGYWVAGQTTAEHSTISVYFWHANRTDLVTNVQLADVCAVLKSKQDWASFHISALESEVVVTSSGHGSGILKESMTYSSPLPMLRKMASFLDGEISHLNRIILESRRRRPGVTLLVTDDLVTHRLTVGMASTNTIHNVDFLKFVDSALKIIPESHNLIPPQYRFSKAHFQGAAVVKGMVNGLSLPTDFAHLHRSNTFAERLRAETLLVRRLEVGGRLDDVVITNVLLTKGNQQVSSGLSLDTDLEMENLDIASGVVDTWNWTALVSDAIYLDSGGTISKDVEFESDVTTKAGLNIGHLVKTMNLANFFRFAMRTDSPQSIPAMIEWLDVELQRDMIVSSSLINEFNLEDFVLVRNPKWHSARLFLPTVVAGSLEVVGEINGLKLKDDILTTEGHQIIKGIILLSPTL